MVYDIAIVGAGCAGWQLLYQLSLRPDWKEKSVLLIEAHEQPLIYPTWCFWVKEEHPFEFLSSKAWTGISIGLNSSVLEKPIHPYRYIYIDGERFYSYFLNEFLPKFPQINFIKPLKVDSVTKDSDSGFLINAQKSTFKAKKVYSSIDFSPSPPLSGQLNLSQNFKGWKVQFSEPVWDEKKALFMDFRESSSSPFEFMYILPFSSTEGLVEWTTFYHNNQLEPDYESKIQHYLEIYFPGKKYTIINREKGRIPMSNKTFKGMESNGVIYLGTVAGMIKPSTGYTFNRITKDSKALAEKLEGKPSMRYHSNVKFSYYDTLILRILRDNPEKAMNIFKALFRNTSYSTIFKFLDEETTFWEDVLIFSRLPFFPLIQAIFRK